MEGALIILLVTVVTGVVLWYFDRRHRSAGVGEGAGTEGDETEKGKNDGTVAVGSPSDAGESVGSGHEGNGGVCCGQHLVCESDTLSPVSAEILYYDDEELDRFVGRSGLDYTDAETEEFQEILLTMRPEDVSGWARSITQRRIELPPVVRDELLMMVNEQRANRLN